MASPSLRRADIAAALAVLPVAAYVVYESGRWPRLPDLGNPAWIPRGVAACLAGAALWLLGRALTGRSLPLVSPLLGADRRRVLRVAALTGAYVLGLEPVGFLAATALYLLGFGAALGERRWGRLALFAAVVPVAIHLLFDQTLNVPLPRGPFR